jgi:NhaA family Na+:H+ antiporter
MASDTTQRGGRLGAFREFFEGEASGGLVLIAAAVLALILANSPLAASYFAALEAPLGPLHTEAWINDALMAVFFLQVALEIKREAVEGELSTWPRRALPGFGALGGMLAPALIYAAVNHDGGEALRGWAIPSATDIAFAVAAVSALGSRVPASLRLFLTALAIIDDLGAVIIIALFYEHGLSLPDLCGAAVVLAALVLLNRRGVTRLWPYLLLGIVLWVFVFRSGLHATLAGVALGLTIPLKTGSGVVPLVQLEERLDFVVPFLIVPIFGFANAGLSLTGMTPAAVFDPVTLGVALGLLLGKPLGVMAASWLAIRSGVAEFPAGASRGQFFGVAALCGIGFTMSLFITLLAFPEHPEFQVAAKLGIIIGSVLSAALGCAALAVSRSR